MVKVTREELLKFAHLSRIDVNESEIESLLKQLNDVLNYARRVQNVAQEAQELLHKNENAWREDEVIKTDPQPLLSNAPEHESGYFVVPVILENE
ncbi:hypothetical protein Noda2021_03390 [Candidatus Dependentiae bacterium Noda2021]|nr:hypothetical protein Noda2021_03390 [Candidatus Dependentiae bacterium Noda2021]